MIVDHDAQLFGEPADHLRIERLSGAAGNAQSPAHAGRETIASSDQHAIGRWRSGEVGDRVLVDHSAGAFDREAAVVEQGGMPQGQRAGYGIVEPIGPTWIGQIPEPIVAAQLYGIAQIAFESQQCAQRHFQRLGWPGGAGRAHQDERRIAIEHHGLAFAALPLQCRPEVVFAYACCATAHGHHVGTVIEFVELGAVVLIGHHPIGPRTMQALLDGLGTERGEQRLIDRADAPGTQYRDQQFDRAWHQPGDAITGLDALTAQEIAELRRMGL